MAIHDSIADMLTMLRNAATARHEKVDVYSSKEKIEIIKILKNEGYIKNFRKYSDKNKSMVKIYLKYDETGNPVINKLQKISKPGRRIYRGYKDIPRILNGLGIAIISTSKGILTDRKAREQKVGGEIICYVW